MKIIPLSEGSFTVDKTKQFVPFAEGDQLQEKPAGSLLVEIQPFAIVTGYDIILFDTGLGFTKNGRLQLHQNLMDAGINPSEITKVCMSHLHKDHAAGLVIQQAGEPDQLAFPSARYYINRKEMAFAFEKGLPSYETNRFQFLQNHPQVELLDDEGRIDGYISHQLTAAHSPFHQVFTIKEDGKTVFFGGDDAPQLQQMRHRFVAKYDFDGRKTMELRQEWWKRGEEEKWTFLFYHDVKNPVWAF